MITRENLAKLTVYFVSTLVFLLISFTDDLISTTYLTIYFLTIWLIPAVMFFSGLKERKRKLLLPWIIITLIHLAIPGVACVMRHQGDTKSDPNFYDSDLATCCTVSFLSLSFIMAFIIGVLTFNVYYKMEKYQSSTEPDILSEVRTLREMTGERNPHLRVETTGERLETTIVRVADTDNKVELMPPSYSEIVNEGLPSYGDVSNNI